MDEKKRSPYRYDAAHSGYRPLRHAADHGPTRVPDLSLTDGARIDGTACAHSSLCTTRNQCTMTMKDGISLLHTITRRSTALSSTAHMIAMHTPDCLLDGTMPREHADLTMVAGPNSMAAAPNTPRTNEDATVRSRCFPPCFCARLVPPTLFPFWERTRALLITRFRPMAPATSRTLRRACTTQTASWPTEATPGFIGRHYQLPYNIS